MIRIRRLVAMSFVVPRVGLTLYITCVFVGLPFFPRGTFLGASLLHSPAPFKCY